MKLAKWDPFSELEQMQRALMGDSFFSGTTTPLAADVYTEGDDRLVVDAYLPGFSKDEIDVDVHEGVLEIRAERHEKEEDKDRKYMVRETSTSLYRRIRLPKYADGDKVDAHLEDGTLKVTVPFKELPKPKKVQISDKAKSKKKK